MNIRPEQSADREGIHAVHATSFPSNAEAKLVDALRAAQNLTVSWVAEEDGQIVGHVGFSPVSLDGTTGGLGLAPVAVCATHRQRGIADQLIRAGLEECKRVGCGFVVVLGDPTYYSRFGFEKASGWSLQDEYGGGDAFQALELQAAAIPDAGGRVRYAEPFAAL